MLAGINPGGLKDLKGPETGPEMKGLLVGLPLLSALTDDAFQIHESEISLQGQDIVPDGGRGQAGIPDYGFIP